MPKKELKKEKKTKPNKKVRKKVVVTTDYIDVHTEEDLRNAEERIKEREEN